MEAGSTQSVAFYMHHLQNVCCLRGPGELRVFIWQELKILWSVLATVYGVGRLEARKAGR